MGTTERNIRVNDNLSSKTLKFVDPYFSSYAQNYPGVYDVIRVDDNNKLYTEIDDRYISYYLRINGENILILYKTIATQRIVIGYSTYTLPSNFGVVTYIAPIGLATTYSAYRFTKTVFDTKLNVNGTQINNIYFNGTQINNVYLNNEKVF